MINKIDVILPRVESPARYTGNELNSIKKDLSEDMIRFCIAFPDIYEVGMSHLGLQIIYQMLNKEENIYCERVFAPWVDLEKELRENDVPLFSLETKTSLKDFDFLGFTLQYEMSYSNILNMMNMAGITLFSKDRKEDEPIIILGGPCAYNPEPMADFADIILIGEGEEAIIELMDLYKKSKQEKLSKNEFLLKAAQIWGIYVPSFYEVQYNEDGTLKSFNPLTKSVPAKIRKRFVKDLDTMYFPETMIVPYIQVVHDRILLELFRGCTRGCRFCQAGMIYRPLREKSLEVLKRNADQLIENTGYEEVSLSSLSTTDYSCLPQLTEYLIDKYEDKKVAVGLPSLRLDNFSIELAQKIQKVKKTGLTFAPEAGTQRLRDVINKGVTEEELMSAVKKAFESGWGNLKLYFMIGLPTETLDDIDGIIDLAYKVVDEYDKTESPQKNKKVRLSVSTSSFVPKAFTPFQWVAQNSAEEIKEKQSYIIRNMRNKKIEYSWHEPYVSRMEGAFARGDRRLSQVIYKAWEKGCRFDGWKDYFNYEGWMAAFQETGLDPDFYALRERTYEELLPWDFIDIGVTKEFLIKEHKKAINETVTDFCKYKCVNCGFNEFEEGWRCDVYSKNEV